MPVSRTTAQRTVPAASTQTETHITVFVIPTMLVTDVKSVSETYFLKFIDFRKIDRHPLNSDFSDQPMPRSRMRKRFMRRCQRCCRLYLQRRLVWFSLWSGKIIKLQNDSEKFEWIQQQILTLIRTLTSARTEPMNVPLPQSATTPKAVTNAHVQVVTLVMVSPAETAAAVRFSLLKLENYFFSRYWRMFREVSQLRFSIRLPEPTGWFQVLLQRRLRRQPTSCSMSKEK